MKNFLVLIGIGLVLVSCGDDDVGGIPGESLPPRPLAEVAAENDAEIQEYLSTHFYNYDEFQNPPADFDFRIVIDTIAGENSDRIPLLEQVSSATVNVSSFEFRLSDEQLDVPHTFYYLEAEEGIGVSPTIADSTFVQFEGSLLNGTVFSGINNNGEWFDLARIQAPLQGLRGFAEGMVKLQSGGAIITNPDGTFNVDQPGIGLVIFPSGLGAFNSNVAAIPNSQFNPVIFRLKLLLVNTTDHDNDGIPSIDEDLNGNGYLFDDNSDEESEIELGGNNAPLVSDFQDFDDDNDGVSTRDEISDEDGNIIFPYPDSNNDGIPDYLDPDTN